MHVIISKWENIDVSSCVQHPDCDPDHSQNIMGYKMDQHPSSDFVHDGQEFLYYPVNGKSEFFYPDGDPDHSRFNLI